MLHDAFLYVAGTWWKSIMNNGGDPVTRNWPSFETKGIGTDSVDDVEMQRRWEVYDREMSAIIAAGGLYQDADGWWVDDATGELIGPDPEIERPLTDDEISRLRPFAEVFPELAEAMATRRRMADSGQN